MRTLCHVTVRATPHIGDHDLSPLELDLERKKGKRRPWICNHPDGLNRYLGAELACLARAFSVTLQWVFRHFQVFYGRARRSSLSDTGRVHQRFLAHLLWTGQTQGIFSVEPDLTGLSGWANTALFFCHFCLLFVLETKYLG